MAKLGSPREVEGSHNNLEHENLARFAVDHHNNNQNAVLQFHRVVSVKQQVVAGTMYHITLEAADGAQKKVYEAKVWVKPWEDFKQVQHFNHIGDA